MEEFVCCTDHLTTFAVGRTINENNPKPGVKESILRRDGVDESIMVKIENEIENEIKSSLLVHDFIILVYIWAFMLVVVILATILDCTGACTVDGKGKKKKVKLPDSTGAAAAEADIEPVSAPDKGECVDVTDVKIEMKEP